MMARLGSARPTLETLMARNEPRCTWPSQTPSGTEMASAMTMAIAAISSCVAALLSSSDA